MDYGVEYWKKLNRRVLLATCEGLTARRPELNVPTTWDEIARGDPTVTYLPVHVHHYGLEVPCSAFCPFKSSCIMCAM